MNALESLAGQVQELAAKIGALDHRWLALAAVAIVLAIIVFALDKPQSLLWLLILYTVGFVALQISAVREFAFVKSNLRYIQLGVGAVPIIALLVLKFKRKRK